MLIAFDKDERDALVEMFARVLINLIVISVCCGCRGDYRTGKRLNMRKLLAYVASDFRKDKIWLRRSLPTQRQYQILMAVDDSSSMNHNQTKEVNIQSSALEAKTAKQQN